MVFAVLIGVNVYFFFLRGGTSLRALMKTTELAKEPGGGAADGGLGSAGRRRCQGEVGRSVGGRGARRRRHDGRQRHRRAALEGDGLPPATVNALATALGKVFDLRTVRAGHGYTLRFDAEDHLRAVEYRVSPALAYHVARDPATEAWKATKDEKPLETRNAEIGGVIGSSLYDAVKRTGESTSLVGWFVDTFAWDINFYIDSNAGDRFKHHRREEATSAASSTSTGACSRPSTRGAPAPSARSGSSRATARPAATTPSTARASSSRS